jgi:hypothetical protein
MLMFAPWLAKIIPEWSGYNRTRKVMDSFTDYFKKPVKEHITTYSDDFQRYTGFNKKNTIIDIL